VAHPMERFFLYCSRIKMTLSLKEVLVFVDGGKPQNLEKNLLGAT